MPDALMLWSLAVLVIGGAMYVSWIGPRKRRRERGRLRRAGQAGSLADVLEAASSTATAVKGWATAAPSSAPCI
jgi:hypothetical protein